MAEFYSEQAFFEAWQRGVDIAGASYFGNEATAPSPAASKWDLPPRINQIDAALGWLSSGEAAFLAAMVSLYNSDLGGSMQRRLGLDGLADICAALDEKRRRVIADLLISYAGW